MFWHHQSERQQPNYQQYKRFACMAEKGRQNIDVIDSHIVTLQADLSPSLSSLP